jgi:hypothetical protein
MSRQHTEHVDPTEARQEVIADWLAANLPRLDDMLTASRTDWATVEVDLPSGVSFTLTVSINN